MIFLSINLENYLWILAVSGLIKVLKRKLERCNNYFFPLSYRKTDNTRCTWQTKSVFRYCRPNLRLSWPRNPENDIRESRILIFYFPHITWIVFVSWGSTLWFFTNNLKTDILESSQNSLSLSSYCYFSPQQGP
jgi:hypothetical protein